MNTISKERIETIIQEPMNFRLGDYLSEGYELLKKDYWKAFLVTLILGFVNGIPVVGWVASANIPKALYVYEKGGDPIGELFKFDRWKDISIFYLVALVLPIVLIFILYFGLVMGMVGISSQSGYQEEPSIFLSILLLFVYLLIFIISIFIGVLLFYANPILSMSNCTWKETLDYSYKLAKKKTFFMVFLFILVASLLASVGVIGCIIGLYFTMPFYYTATYAAEKDIFFPNDELTSEINEIGVEG